MAMSKQVHIAPRDAENYRFICGICLYNFENPRALPCLHTFCLECIRQWAEHGCDSKRNETPADITTSSCPNCRQIWQLPPDGLGGLPSNFYITQREQAESKLPSCMSCEDADAELLGRCKECGWLCKNCLTSHRSMKALKDHIVLELEHLRKGKTEPISFPYMDTTISQEKKRYGKWEREKTFGLCWKARCDACAVAPNGDIAITEETEEGNHVDVFSQDGKFKFPLDTTVDLLPGQKSKPFGIAVNTRGYFYVTDCTPWVRVYNDSGSYLFLFHTVPPPGLGPLENDPNCEGIAIHEERVYVGESSRCYISIHKTNGNHIRSLHTHGYVPQFITYAGDEVLTTCSAGEAVRVFDSSDAYVRDVISPLKKVPLRARGMCLTKDNELLVVSGDDQQCCIFRFSLSGIYLGSITNDVLPDSAGIAAAEIDGVAKLFVVSKTLVTVFRWVDTSPPGKK